MPKKINLLGAHMSTAGGLSHAITAGESIGCTAIQLFTANNRSWSFQECDPVQIKAFIEAQKKSTVRVVISHAGYLINLGSPNKLVAAQSQKALQSELARCAQLAISLVVVHPGAHLDSSPETCIQQIAHAIDRVLTNTPRSPIILLENTAGQGTSIGHTLEQLAEIRSQITQKDRVGFCFDTCHAHAAGYDLTTPDCYQKFWQHADRILGIENIGTIHLNDTQKALGSRVDRHARIATGTIGLAEFKLLMHDTRFADVPKILETPYETLADHKEEIQLLQSI
jgi:deoxyribonuclease-4